MITQKENNVNEKIIEFEKHKNFATKIQRNLAQIYQQAKIGGGLELSKKGLSIAHCGDILQFQRYYNEEQTTKLHGANFCKHKLCPMCAWRWHLKTSRIISKTFEILGKNDYYHLILTIPNTPYLTKDFLKDLKIKASNFMKTIAKSKDYFIGLEITIDENKKYHPHFHIVYINQLNKPLTRKQIQTEWAKIANTGTNYAIGLQKKCYGDKIALELTKYILKFENIEPNTDILKVIDFATYGIRKFSTSGAIKQAEQEAKRQIDKENFEELENLSKFESLIEFYNFINGAYTLTNTKLQKAKVNNE